MKKNGHKTDTEIPTNQQGKVPIKREKDPRYHRKPFYLTIYVDGEKQRPHFATEREAEKAWVNHCRMVKKFGTLPYKFDAAAQTEYDHCTRKLNGRASITEAVDFYLIHAPTTEVPKLRVAIDRFVQMKETTLERSHVHVKDLRLRLGVLAAVFGDERTIDTIHRNQLIDLLFSKKREPRTIANYVGAWFNFFNYYRRRGDIKVNPVEAIEEEDLPKVRTKPKVILTIPQCRGFLRVVHDKHRRFLRWAVVQMFAGMRDAEAERMHADFCDVSQKIIKVPAAICKTDDDWVLTGLPAPLWEWFAIDADFKGPFPFPSNRAWTAIRDDLAAIESPDERIPNWPYNGIRRSFCTYLMSLHRSADKVATWSRHQNATRLYKSYLSSLVPRPIAVQFVSLTPEAVLTPKSP